MSLQASWAQRIERAQDIMSAAWHILKEDKTLLLLPIASSICLMLLVVSYLVPTVVEVVTGKSVVDGDQADSAVVPGSSIFIVCGDVYDRDLL